MMERLSSVSGCQLTSMCPLQNISQCEVTEQQAEFSVSLYNPLTSVVSRPVRLPVTSCDTLYSITSETGDSLETQMVPIPTEVDLSDKYNIQFIISYLSKVQDIPGRVSGAKCDLVFIASDIPPLGLSKYSVKENGKLSSTLSSSKKKITIGTWMKNDRVKILFDKTGKLSKIITSSNSSDIHLKQEFAFYRGAVGNNSPPNYVVQRHIYIFWNNNNINDN